MSLKVDFTPLKIYDLISGGLLSEGDDFLISELSKEKQGRRTERQLDRIAKGGGVKDVPPTAGGMRKGSVRDIARGGRKALTDVDFGSVSDDDSAKRLLRSKKPQFRTRKRLTLSDDFVEFNRNVSSLDNFQNNVLGGINQLEETQDRINTEDINDLLDNVERDPQIRPDRDFQNQVERIEINLDRAKQQIEEEGGVNLEDFVVKEKKGKRKRPSKRERQRRARQRERLRQEAQDLGIQGLDFLEGLEDVLEGDDRQTVTKIKEDIIDEAEDQEEIKKITELEGEVEELDKEQQRIARRREQRRKRLGVKLRDKTRTKKEETSDITDLEEVIVEPKKKIKLAIGRGAIEEQAKITEEDLQRALEDVEAEGTKEEEELNKLFERMGEQIQEKEERKLISTPEIDEIKQQLRENKETLDEMEAQAIAREQEGQQEEANKIRAQKEFILNNQADLENKLEELIEVELEKRGEEEITSTSGTSDISGEEGDLTSESEGLSSESEKLSQENSAVELRGIAKKMGVNIKKPKGQKGFRTKGEILFDIRQKIKQTNAISDANLKTRLSSGNNTTSILKNIVKDLKGREELGNLRDQLRVTKDIGKKKKGGRAKTKVKTKSELVDLIIRSRAINKSVTDTSITKFFK